MNSFSLRSLALGTVSIEPLVVGKDGNWLISVIFSLTLDKKGLVFNRTISFDGDTFRFVVGNGKVKVSDAPDDLYPNLLDTLLLQDYYDEAGIMAHIYRELTEAKRQVDIESAYLYLGSVFIYED